MSTNLSAMACIILCSRFLSISSFFFLSDGGCRFVLNSIVIYQNMGVVTLARDISSLAPWSSSPFSAFIAAKWILSNFQRSHNIISEAIKIECRRGNEAHANNICSGASGGSQRPAKDNLWGKSRSRQARSLSKSAAASTPVCNSIGEKSVVYRQV